MDLAYNMFYQIDGLFCGPKKIPQKTLDDKTELQVKRARTKET